MALNTVATESALGDLARRATELASSLQGLRQQMSQGDALRADVVSALQSLAVGAQALRKLDARLAKDRLETQAANLAVEIASQDTIINAP